jgi:NADH-quinone oxidoreductase subunit E
MTADEIRAHIDSIRDQFAESRSLILPALKFAQTEKGWLSRDDVQAVAEATDLTPAYVESVASFYDRLYLRPQGRRVISVCVTLSCMLRGSDVLMDRLCDAEGLPYEGGTSEDGEITIQEAQCLGYCDKAPCLQVDAEETRGPVDPDEAGALLAELRATPSPSEIWR